MFKPMGKLHIKTKKKCEKTEKAIIMNIFYHLSHTKQCCHRRILTLTHT